MSNIKKTGFIFSIFLIFGCSNKTPILSGKLFFDSDTLLIKTKSRGITDTFSVKCSNTGNQPLKIINAEGSCGCTAIQYDSSAISPGGKKILTVTYKHNGDSNSVYIKNIVFLTDGTPKFKVYYLKTVN